MKKIILPIGIIIVIIILVVAFLGSGSPKPTTDNNAPKKVGEATSEITERPEQTEFKILDRIDFQNRILTVNSVKRNYVESGSYPSKPEPGQEFILVNVTIENNSDKTISFNEYDFQIENSTGVRKNSAYVNRKGSVKFW